MSERITDPLSVSFQPTDSEWTELRVLSLMVQAISWGEMQSPPLTPQETARIAWYINDRYKGKLSQ